MAKKPKADFEQSDPLLRGDRTSVAATPSITSPAGNGYVLPGTDLLVTISTNRTDLAYVVTFTDLTPPLAPAVVQNVGAPGSSPFMVTIPGANLAADQQYEIHVAVAPGTWPPPNHLDHTVNVHTNAPPGAMMLTMATREPAEPTAAKRKKK